MSPAKPDWPASIGARLVPVSADIETPVPAHSNIIRMESENPAEWIERRDIFMELPSLIG
jgi:hypothetical protein